MSKIPNIERPYGDFGLTGECAYLWALFLANEAEMDGDVTSYDKFMAMVDTLKPQAGKAIPSAVHYQALEDAIERYKR